MIRKYLYGTMEDLRRLMIWMDNDYPEGVDYGKCEMTNPWVKKGSLVLEFDDRNAVRRFYNRYGIYGTCIGGKNKTCCYFKKDRA